MKILGKVFLGVCGSSVSEHIDLLITELLHLSTEISIVCTNSSLKFLKKPAFLNIYSDDDYLSSPLHIDLTNSVDTFIIFPATANTISKISSGICDNLLTTCVLCYTGRIIIAPAMNKKMWNNNILQENVNNLKKRGFIFVDTVDMVALSTQTYGDAIGVEVDYMIEKLLEWTVTKLT